MMISKKTKYALKALCHLAATPDSRPVLISEMAKAESIPKKFLEFILLSLRKGGVLQSRIGKGGGYYLASPPSTISVGSVVRILEGDLAPVPCLSETNTTRCDGCLDETACGIRLIMTDVNASLAHVLNSLTLADMIDRSETERSKRANVVDFSI